ncbi:CHASE domain-containing protein [Methylomonas sp. SURF-2]|uniref:diguanylate cyclase n=1 Tax=Methylomonas subterranea TaxID=2952225 RepID=A0ABT1TGR3_9GAMM|nr:CHASE domain-containing protein [Methylomonas sp. SURF-2]MCQ8104653.1 CHASE domain-containing protein [Methylomonas sp. SURF-2]
MSSGKPGRSASKRSWRTKIKTDGSACLVFVLGLSITAAGWHSAQRSLTQDTRAYFDFRVKQLLATIENRIDNYQQVLQGTRGLFTASVAVERSEFQRYIDSLNLAARYPGIQGVGFSLIVAPAQLPAHLESIRREGFTDYEIHPAGQRELYTTIIYLEPFAGRNLRAFGYDMFTEPTRRQAMVYARDMNTVGMTGKVTLVQEIDSDIQAGFLMYLPVFENFQAHDNAAERRKHIIGWVYAPFRMRDFMSGIGGERSADLHLSIYDGEEVSDTKLMYSDQIDRVPQKAISKRLNLTVGGHTWTLVIHSEAGLKNWLNNYQPLLILVGGGGLSLLLALSTRQYITRGQALAMAAAVNRALQESESRFRLLADSAPVLIWLTDVKQSAIWFNKQWLSFTGRPLPEQLDQGWLNLVEPSQTELVLKLLQWHYQTRKPFNVEFRLRRHDGEYRWILNTGAPRFNNDGEFVGFIGSCIDITRHREMEEELWELATTDGLTGFLNRRHFLVRLREEFDRIQRNAELQSALLMLDLDHFKRINDHYGHAVGDEVLQHFAQIIRSQQRKIDIVGRLGGEEFAIILPDTELSEAYVLAERLLHTVAGTPLAHEMSLIEITISIGVAQLNIGSESPDAALKQADQALYRAKKAGRNQIVLQSQPETTPNQPRR